MLICWLSFTIVLTLTQFTEAEPRLIFAQVLFRHGARAPSAELTNPAYKNIFPRGLGELTDRGFENSYGLGKLLRKRYVETGFLDPNLKPSQMYWRSVNKNRCLSTASTVGAAMFEDPPHHLHVPVVTETQSENLLNYNMNNCPGELELIRESCPNFDGNFHPWPFYEEFLAKCLNYSHVVFDTYPFHTMEAYMNEYKNGLPLPKLIDEHAAEIVSLYANVAHFSLGTGHYHNPRKMKLKFGNLVDKMLRDMQKAGSVYLEQKKNQTVENSESRKFVAYSSQDWIVTGVLDSLGILNEAIGLNKTPEYNAMIIMELWDRDDELYVKVYYKNAEISEELIDLSGAVRGCPRDKLECPLNTFLSCCEVYRNSGDYSKNCDSANPNSVRYGRSTREKEKPFMMAGPE